MALIFNDSPNRYAVGNCDTTEMVGIWSNVPTGGFADEFQIVEPSFGARTGTKSLQIINVGGNNLRATFTNTVATEVYFSAGFYLPNLPGSTSWYRVEFSNSANTRIIYAAFTPSGTIGFYNDAGTLLAETPVCIAAASWTWFEFRIAPTAGIIQVRNAQGTQILNASITSIPQTLGNLRLQVDSSGADLTANYHIDSINVKDNVGAFQNGFYGAERRNYVINAVADDPATAWSFVGRRMFGPGVGQMLGTTADKGWRVPDAASLEVGSGAFTVESTYRWNALPGAGQSQYLAAKWFPGSAMSWGLRLYESAGVYRLEFAYTTGGTSGTQVVVHDFPFVPVLFTPYSIAVCRNAGTNRLFINGQRQGPAVADAATYHDNASLLTVGARQSTATALADSFNGWVDEFRFTVGVGRYAADYTPAVAAFGRSVGTDPSFASVQLLMGWDTASVDESGAARTVTQNGVATQLTTDDGLFGYQSIDKTARDDTFVQAALLSATGTVEFISNAVAATTLAVGGTTYTFRAAVGATANEVLIGVDAEATLFNLHSAVNALSGGGTLYGSATVINANVASEQLPGAILRFTALVPGTAGNSIVFTTSVAGAIISGAGFLAGGLNIPAPGIYRLDRLPAGVTAVESVTLFTRRSVFGAGSASLTPSFIDSSLALSTGLNAAAPANPATQIDYFSSNGGAAWTTAAFVGAKIQVNRTA